MLVNELSTSNNVTDAAVSAEFHVAAEILQPTAFVGARGHLVRPLCTSVSDKTAGNPLICSAKTCSELGWQPQGLYHPELEPVVCAESDDHQAGFECTTTTITDADAICRGVGARLCTAAELLAGEGSGTGCDDDQMVWSSTNQFGILSCDEGEMLVVHGRGIADHKVGTTDENGDRDGCWEPDCHPPVCDGGVASVRCCADVVCAVDTPDQLAHTPAQPFFGSLALLQIYETALDDVQIQCVHFSGKQLIESGRLAQTTASTCRGPISTACTSAVASQNLLPADVLAATETVDDGSCTFAETAGGSGQSSELGTVHITDEWQEVVLQESYARPLVLLGVPSRKSTAQVRPIWLRKAFCSAGRD